MKNEKWNKYYQLAKQYYEKNGNLIISNADTDEDIELKEWLVAQRRHYKLNRLAKEKIALLNEIGMVWSLYDYQWNEYYVLAKEYYEKNGNLLVPIRYITKENKQLGSWLSHQRRYYKSNQLTEEKIELLERIGMIWEPTDRTWNEAYQTAKCYYEENGNLDVPNELTYKNINLGSWIRTQRFNYSHNKLTSSRIELLNKIGMEWDPIRNQKYIWDRNYSLVLDFYKKYKHLYVPINYVVNGVKIGVWLYDQKIEYHNNTLSEYRKKKLDALDKSWLEPSNNKSSFPEQVVLYYVKKRFPSASKLKTKEISEIDIFIPELKVGIEYDGPSHLRMVKKDIEKGSACKKEGIKLIRIRDRKCPKLDDDSIKIILEDDSFSALNNGIEKLFKLFGISDISIDIERDYYEISDNYIKTLDLDWYNAYEKLKEYYNEHGNIDVPIFYKTSDGFLLGHWLSNIRSSFKSPQLKGMRLNHHKIQLLNDLGMDWSPKDSLWNKMYELAKSYFVENKNLLIPDTYKTSQGVNLGRWISTQRNNYRKKILSKEKITALEKIDMIWDVNEYQWLKMYNLAQEYYNQNGNILIPDKYLTKDGVRLGIWMGHQRRAFREKKLSQERVMLLEKIGIIWDVRKESR